MRNSNRPGFQLLIICFLLFAIGILLPGCFGTIRTAKKIAKKTEDIAIDALRALGGESVSKAAAVLSVEGGYGQAELRIQLPEELRDLQKKLEPLNLAGELEKIEQIINDAAEQAITEAVPIILHSVRRIKFKKAYDLITGHSTDLTKYIRRKSAGGLKQAFEPIIKTKLDELQALSTFQDLLEKYNRIPLVEKKEFNLEGYVADQAINGLFVRMAEAEKQVRKDPSTSAAKLIKKLL